MLGWFRLYGMAAAASKVETTALKAICQKKSDCFKKKLPLLHLHILTVERCCHSNTTTTESHVLMLHCNTPSSRLSKKTHLKRSYVASDLGSLLKHFNI